MKPSTVFAVALVMVIAGVVFFPVFACACQRATPKSQAMASVKQAGTPLIIYESDNNEVFPGVQDQATFRAVMDPYIKNDQLLAEDLKHQIRIAFNTRLANVDAETLKEPWKTIALTTPVADTESKPITDMVVGFADSSARAFKPDKWKSDYADLLGRNFPRVSQTFLPSVGPSPPKP